MAIMFPFFAFRLALRFLPSLSGRLNTDIRRCFSCIHFVVERALSMWSVMLFSLPKHSSLNVCALS